MNKHLKYALVLAAALCITVTAQAQQLAVERFSINEKDQTARIYNSRKDQNNKVCAIVKLETPLLLQDLDFYAGSVGIEHTEQKVGEIWVYLSPGTRRITINHKHLGTVRDYEFGEALKEATVYIMKLKSGNVKTVVEDNVMLQYMEVICEADGATISIDDDAPIPFEEGKFDKLLSYGEHKYTIEAPLYHPLIGKVEVTAKKQLPLQAELQPAFGKIIVNTRPEQGADIFVDNEKRGQSPLTIERLSSGIHKIRVIKAQFLPVTQEQTVTDGATETLTLSMQPNFAVISLTTPNGGDIYINDEKVASGTWSGRLTPGQYKVEVHKPAHRNSVATVVSEAGKNKTILLEAPALIYGSLDIRSSGNTQASVYIDGKEYEKTPAIIKNIPVGNHNIELRAAGYKPYRQTVEIQEGKMLPLSASLQEEEDKTGPLKTADNYKSPTQTSWGFFSYRYSPIAPFGVSMGFCKKFGWYFEGSLGNAGDYSRSFLTTGGTARITNYLYVYGGLGYSENMDNDSGGLCCDAGIILKPFKYLVFSAGYARWHDGRSGFTAEVGIAYKL